MNKQPCSAREAVLLKFILGRRGGRATMIMTDIAKWMVPYHVQRQDWNVFSAFFI